MFLAGKHARAMNVPEKLLPRFVDVYWNWPAWVFIIKVYLWQNSITRNWYQIIQIVHASIRSWIVTSRFYVSKQECIKPKLKGKNPFQVSCSQSKCRKAYWVVKCITRKGITQIGITRNGKTRKGKTRKGITRKGIAQIGITRKGITKIGITLKGITQIGITRNNQWP